MVNIQGSTVVVTGGQRGLGKAIVEELLQRGAAKVYATARVPRPSDDARVVSVALDVDDPKNDPRQVARDILDGVERDDAEVLADEITRYVKAALSGPVEALQAR